MKRVTAVLLLVSLFCVGWYVLGAGVSGEQVVASPEAKKTESAGDAPGPIEPVESLPNESDDDSPGRQAVLIEASSSTMSVDDLESPIPRLTCKVVLTELSGFQNEHSSGTAEVTFWVGGRGNSDTFSVEDGVFEVSRRDIEAISVSSMTLEGLGVDIEDRSTHHPMRNGEVVIHARVPTPVRLSVLSMETGDHLTGLSVVNGHKFLNDELLAVACDSVGTANLSSPLELKPTSKQLMSRLSKFWVHSPGYAWQPVFLDMLTGGEREIRLELAGELSVRFLGEPVTGGISMFLSLASDEFSLPLAALRVSSPGEVNLCGLPPGEYVANVRNGEWYDDYASLGRAEVEVIAGRMQTADIVLEAPGKVGAAVLAGTVSLSKEWGVTEFALSAEYVGREPLSRDVQLRLTEQRMTRSSSDSELWSFSFGEVPLGRYSLVASFLDESVPVEYGVLVTVGPTGLWDVRLEVPPPGNVSITLTDYNGGELDGMSVISWGPLLNSGEVGSGRSIVRPGRSNGLFEFRAPVGRIGVRSWGTGLVTMKEELLILEGENVFRFQLEQNCPLTIVFLDGQTLVPAKDFWYPEPTHVDGDGELLFISAGGPEFNTALSHPGRYLFEFPELEGFEPVPDQTISVVRGEKTIHEVQLVRRGR